MINCSKCGRFVGKDGDSGVYFDDSTGMYEYEWGYPLCKKCVDEDSKGNHGYPDGIPDKCKDCLHYEYRPLRFSTSDKPRHCCNRYGFDPMSN